MTIWSARVAASNDDAEELSDGTIYRSNADLDMMFDSGSNYNAWVGMRWQNVTVPQGTTITTAYIQFVADESQSATCDLTVYGEDSDDTTEFTSTTSDITDRTRTTANVAWSVPSWTADDETSAQKTPEIKTVIQEIVDRGSWASGNAMSIHITGGTAQKRVAYTYDGDSAKAPLLYIEYSDGVSVTPAAAQATSAAAIGSVAKGSLSITPAGAAATAAAAIGSISIAVSITPAAATATAAAAIGSITYSFSFTPAAATATSAASIGDVFITTLALLSLPARDFDLSAKARDYLMGVPTRDFNLSVGEEK